MTLDKGTRQESIQKAKDIPANAQSKAKRCRDDGNESSSKRKRPGEGDTGAIAVPMRIPAAVTTDANTSITSIIRVQSELVPMLIGSHGKRISQLQSATHTRIQIATTVWADSPNERHCTISGLPEHVLLAGQRIQELMNKRLHCNEEQVMEQMLIPSSKVGLVIGPKGATIISMKSQSGAEMRVNQSTTCVTGESKRLTITGTKESVEKAKALVTKMIEGAATVYPSASYSNAAINATRTFSGEIIVPRVAVGRIIGRGGEVIKSIGRRTNCQIQFKKDDDMFTQDRTAVILAKTKESLMEATQLITEIVQAPYANLGRSENVECQMLETPTYSIEQSMQAYGKHQLQFWPQQGMQHQQQWNQNQTIQMQNTRISIASHQHHQMLQQPQQPPDYSRAWVDYYRRAGMHA